MNPVCGVTVTGSDVSVVRGVPMSVPTSCIAKRTATADGMMRFLWIDEWLSWTMWPLWTE